MKQITYEWSWACLSLFRKWSETMGDVEAGGSTRIFTLKPAWVWQYVQNWFMVKLGFWPPDPFWVCEQWLRRNNLWHREGADFFRAIDRYAASCEPGHYLKLQPGFLK